MSKRPNAALRPQNALPLKSPRRRPAARLPRGCQKIECAPPHSEGQKRFGHGAAWQAFANRQNDSRAAAQPQIHLSLHSKTFIFSQNCAARQIANRRDSQSVPSFRVTRHCYAIRQLGVWGQQPDVRSWFSPGIQLHQFDRTGTSATPFSRTRRQLFTQLCRSPKHEEGLLGHLLITHLFDSWPTTKAAKTFARTFPPH